MDKRRHCAIITVYKDIDVINRMLSRLPSCWDIYIHIDKKSPLKPEDIKRESIIEKKYKIYWGGINHLKAILSLLRKASIHEYDYYHIITGQDYPIFTEESLEKTLGTDNAVFINTFPLPKKGWWGDGTRIIRYRTIANIIDIRGWWARKINWGLITLQYVFHLQKKMPEYPTYGGLVYCSLPHYAVEYIFTSPMSDDLLKRLKWSLPAEEIFFPTLFMNSPFRNNVANKHFRFMDWPETGLITLNLSHLPDIQSSGALFIRKVDKSSYPLLDYIDNHKATWQ